MPRPSPTNEQILRRLRAFEEYQHRRCQEYFYDGGMLTLSPSLPIPQVDLEQIQDSCNKSTAIYSLAPHMERSTSAFSNDLAIRDDIMFSVYEQWFHGHNVDIDFGSFFAKLIRIETSNDQQCQTIEDIITAHKAWCDHVEISLPLCSRKDSTEKESDHRMLHGLAGINKRQNIYYKLRPLFRALILVIDHHAAPGVEKLVHLIRTDIPSKISAPITFDSISPKLHSDMFSNNTNDNVVVTTLSVAIDFIMALERREREVFSDNQRDSSVIDERGTNSGGCHTIKARSLGYTGPDIQETSSNWFRRSAEEIVLRPFTPLVSNMMSRPGMYDKPIFDQYKKKERVKYGMGGVGERIKLKSQRHDTHG